MGAVPNLSSKGGGLSVSGAGFPKYVRLPANNIFGAGNLLQNQAFKLAENDKWNKFDGTSLEEVAKLFDTNRDGIVQANELLTFSTVCSSVSTDNILDIAEIWGVQNNYIPAAIDNYAKDADLAVNPEKALKSNSAEQAKTMFDKINKENIASVLDIYPHLTGVYFATKESDIIYDICCSNSDTKTKNLFIKKIYSSLSELAKDQKVDISDVEQKFNAAMATLEKDETAPEKIYYCINIIQKRIISGSENYDLNSDGKINNDTQQGPTGDCVYLAVINCLKANPKGQEFLAKLVSKDDKGNIKVHIGGKEYAVTEDELKRNVQFSRGDADVRAVEIALEKYLQETEKGLSSIDYGSYLQTVTEDLFGSVKPIKTLQSEFFDEAADLSKCICTADSTLEYGEHYVRDFNDFGRPCKIITHHEYSVVGSDKDYIYVINPHDSSKTIKMQKSDFKRAFEHINAAEL